MIPMPQMLETTTPREGYATMLRHIRHGLIGMLPILETYLSECKQQIAVLAGEYVLWKYNNNIASDAYLLRDMSIRLAECKRLLAWASIRSTSAADVRSIVKRVIIRSNIK